MVSDGPLRLEPGQSTTTLQRSGRIGMRPVRNPETIIVGLVSDTHGLVRPEVAKAFAGVHLILHAGDVGGSTVLARLATIAPVEAVYGNVDDPHDPALRAERVVTLR